MIGKESRRPLDAVSDQDTEAVRFCYSPALFAAAHAGTAATIDFLLSRGCDLNQCDLNGDTLLHMAAESGNVEVAAHVIKLGLPADKGKCGMNQPAIHYAVRAKHHGTAKALLDAGANVNAMDSWRGKEHAWDISPLDIARDRNDKNMTELLLSYGALSGEEIVRRKTVSVSRHALNVC